MTQPRLKAGQECKCGHKKSHHDLDWCLYDDECNCDEFILKT